MSATRFVGNYRRKWQHGAARTRRNFLPSVVWDVTSDVE